MFVPKIEQRSRFLQNYCSLNYHCVHEFEVPYALHVNYCVLEDARMASVVSLGGKEPYLIISPDGTTIQFRNGGVAGFGSFCKDDL